MDATGEQHPERGADGPALVQALFDAAVDNIFVIDERGLIRAVNASACATFGYSEPELLGHNISMLMTREDSERHDGYLAAYRETGKATIIGVGRDVVGQRRDGSTVPLRLSVGEFEADGQRLYVGICHDISERVRFTERIAFLARNDGLTGCLNRFGLMAGLAELIAEADVAGGRVGVLVIDIDGFKTVNDHHGHAMGDALLGQIAERIRGRLRSGDVLGRAGGDEFVVLATLPGEASDVQRLAEDLVDLLRSPFDVAGRSLRVGGSVGIGLYPDHATDAGELLNSADMAMYAAKRAGGDRVQTFDETLKRRAEAVYEIVNGLRDALDTGRLVLHYQPQFDLRTLEPVGLEALLRWQHPERGLLQPEDFVDVALEWGVMPSLGRWAVKQATADNAALVARGLLDRPVAVNICAPLMSEAAFVPLVTSALAENRLEPRHIELEIIEQVAMTPSLQLTSNIDAMRRLGISVSMDDFGTGYSSLSQLKQQRFTKLKIDGSFIVALPDSAADAAIVRAMLDIADGLGLEMVAEGVETRAQRDLLVAYGCRLGQGYWYARPMPFDDLVAWLESAAYRDLLATV